jgi:hypothetical protein
VATRPGAGGPAPDEVMVTTTIHDPAERRRSYSLLSEVARSVAA